MTDKLIEQLRDEDSYYRIQEKHWCIDAEELERQRLAAADRIEALHEKLAAAYIALSGTDIHASDCATSNAPAYEPGPCDCKDVEAMTEDKALVQRLRDFVIAEDIDLAADRIEALTAENERLRGLLGRIADTDPDDGTEWFHAIARAALEDKQ
jgi:hypothetical protein